MSRNKIKLTALVLMLAIISTVCLTDIDAKTKIKSKSVKINAPSVTLSIGDIATLSAVMKPTNSTDKLKWSSSDENVATVNSYGVVTAVAEGSASITVKTSSNKTAKCAVTVKKSLTESEIKSLVSSELLSDETVKKLIGENVLKEDDVKKLIKENSLSADDVKKLIKENASSVPDGGKVPMIADQKFPYVIGDPNRTGIAGNITGMTVTKNRVKSNISYQGESIYLPYRYSIIITIDVSLITEAQKNTHQAGVIIGSPNVAADIKQINEPYQTYFNGKTLTEILTLYSAYDIDEFFIESAFWETK